MFSCNMRNKALENIFGFHGRCREVQITHQCFIDDLFLFCKIENETIAIIKQILLTFQRWSKLKANEAKSCVYFFGVTQKEKDEILSCL